MTLLWRAHFIAAGKRAAYRTVTAGGSLWVCAVGAMDQAYRACDLQGGRYWDPPCQLMHSPRTDRGLCGMGPSGQIYPRPSSP
jgi:hypothetical protein